MEQKDNGITPDLINDIAKSVKMLKVIKDDNILNLYIKSICNNILIKTNRRKFPQELKYVVIDLIVDKYDSIIDNSQINAIQSMTEYDRTVTFGVSGPLQYKLNLIAQKQLEDNEKLINRYKLLYRT